MKHKVFAFAKINLMLHVTGRRDDGYHTLNTLIAFTDIADIITLEPSEKLGFKVTGPFAAMVPADESNLVMKAIRLMEKQAERTANIEVILDKYIPAYAGLGGGSADAAAMMHALNELWDKPFTLGQLQEMGLQIGAELPVCLAGGAQWVDGIGEKISPMATHALDAVVVWPNAKLATADVFRAYHGHFSRPITATADFLPARNDLTEAAIQLAPAVHDALAALSDCHPARMSGSGSSCFGICRNADHAKETAAKLAAAHPGWWVKPCRINS